MVTLDSSFRTNGYFMVTKSFNSNDYQKADMEVGTDYSIGFPYRVYLSFVATGNSTENSDFKVGIKYLKFDPNADDEEDAGGNVILVGKYRTALN